LERATAGISPRIRRWQTMDFEALVKYLRDNWAAILATVIIVTPILWWILHYIFKSRLDVLKQERDTRRRQLEGLERRPTRANGVALSDNDMKLLRAASAPHAPSETATYAFGASPDAWDDKLCMRYIRLVDLGLLKPAGTSEVVISDDGWAYLSKRSA